MREQSVIISTAELMPSSEYLEFLYKFLEKYNEDSVIEEKMALRALSPGHFRYGFLKFNYEHPKVREILLYD